MPHKLPLIIDGWNIDPNNIKDMPPQILNLANNKLTYYELSKGQIIEKEAVEVKQECAKPDDPLWHKEIEIVENVFKKQKGKTSYTECPPGRARKFDNKTADIPSYIDELEFSDKGEPIKRYEIEEGKLYGMKPYTILYERKKHRGGTVYHIELDDNYFYGSIYNYRNTIPLFIFKAEKVEDYVSYSGKKYKLITPCKISEQELNKLF